MFEYRILVVDDFAPFRDVVSRIFAESQALPDLLVVREASDGLAAVREAEIFQPHLTLLDIGLPYLNGIEAARRVRTVAPESKLIFISSYCSAAMVREAMSTGAYGYVVKFDVLCDLPAAIESVIRDRQFISKRVAGYDFSASVDL